MVVVQIFLLLHHGIVLDIIDRQIDRQIDISQWRLQQEVQKDKKKNVKVEMITWAGYQMSCLTCLLRHYGSKNYDFLLDVYIETAQQQHRKTQHNTTQHSNTDKFVIKTRVSIIDNHNHICNDNHSSTTTSSSRC